jgi:colicin import membrane protein
MDCAGWGCSRARLRDVREGMVKDRDRAPQPRRRTSGKWIALALAILVNLAFVGVLVFSVTWRNPPAPAVSAELYAPPVRTPVPPKPEPPKPEPPKPEPPKPEPPKPEQPKPEPPKPEPPKVEKPDPHEAEIALKAKQAQERKLREDAEKTRVEAEKRKREAEEKLKADAKREADVRERQQRETQALREQAEREARLRAETEAKARAAAEARALVQAENAARARAEGDWIRRIQAKVRGNIILPPDIPGNPEAIFEVVQLPTGEILDAQLRKSSGVRAYDEAVQRAILKSSPLPRPERAELFQRTLTLKFRPVD